MTNSSAGPAPAPGDHQKSPVQLPTEPDKPVVRDPALARALDLLKGLAIVGQFRTR